MTLIDVVRPHRSTVRTCPSSRTAMPEQSGSTRSPPFATPWAAPRANPSVSNSDRPATEPRPTQLTATRNSLPIHHPGDHAATTREPASAPRGQRRVDPTVPSRLLLRSRRWSIAESSMMTRPQTAPSRMPNPNQDVVAHLSQRSRRHDRPSPNWELSQREPRAQQPCANVGVRKRSTASAPSRRARTRTYRLRKRRIKHASTSSS